MTPGCFVMVEFGLDGLCLLFTLCFNSRAGAGFMSNMGYTIPMVAVVIGVVL